MGTVLQCCGLASGSAGNSYLVTGGNTRVLIDAGLSAARIKESLKRLSVTLDSLDGIIITHEHEDHIRGAGIFARTTGTPIYISRHTHAGGIKKFKGTEKIRHIESDRPFAVGELEFIPFTTLHDAADPLGLTVSFGDRKIGFATDLGHVTHLVRERMRGCNLLILEHNHDEDMLMNNSRYPWKVKQRIRSTRGHLSNDAAGVLLSQIVDEDLKTIMVAHVSSENNDPILIRRHIDQVLISKGMPDKQVIFLSQNEMSDVVTV